MTDANLQQSEKFNRQYRRKQPLHNVAATLSKTHDRVATDRMGGVPMDINQSSEAGETSFFPLECARSKKYKASSFARPFGLMVLSVVALMLIPDKAWSQQRRHERAIENPATPATPVIEPTSLLGRALASCEKDAAVEETFALPGLKGEVMLDRCYKGHGHLICIFDALITEAKSLTDSYTPVVDAKYPDFNSVENICQIKPDNLASHMAGAEDFTKRFAVLKSKYESASKCAINIKQTFRDVVLSDMTQPPEILKSMTESIEGDVARVSDVENQTVDLAAKVETAKKAMKTIGKIYRALCVKDKTTPGGAANADPAVH